MDADPPDNRGRQYGQGRNRQALVRSTGVVSTACKQGDLRNCGRSGSGGSESPTISIGGRPGRKSERAVRPLKPGNSGGGKGPYFRCALEEGEDKVIDDESGNTNSDPDASEEAVSESEGGAQLPLLPAV